MKPPEAAEAGVEACDGARPRRARCEGVRGMSLTSSLVLRYGRRGRSARTILARR